MSKRSDLRTRILAAEHRSVSTADHLSEYINRIGMLHLNLSKYSRSAENVWDFRLERPVWPVLIELLENKKIFFCRCLNPARTTYASPEVAKALVALAGDREAGLGGRLREVYDAIKKEGPLSRRDLSEVWGCSTKECKKILQELVQSFLITVFEFEPLTDKQTWGNFLYWTVDEWMLEYGVDTSQVSASVQDKERVVLAAAACLVSEEPKEIAKWLRWPTEQVRQCLENIPQKQKRVLREPIRIEEKQGKK